MRMKLKKTTITKQLKIPLWKKKNQTFGNGWQR